MRLSAAKAIDHYLVQATKGQRLIVDCAAAGIDSKLTAVLIVADSAGHDLLVNRRGGVLDFTAPADGDYFIKVHDLTYQGGADHFYRLALLRSAPPPLRSPASRRRPRSAPSRGRPMTSRACPRSPNRAERQAGRSAEDHAALRDRRQFFPAADVDLFEFEAKKGEGGGSKSFPSVSGCPPIRSCWCSA